jgi:hypothetical protein
MIDELDRLQAFRAQVPEPRPEAIRAARAALEDVIAAPPPRPSRRRPSRVLLVRATLAAGLAGVILTVVSVSGPGAPDAPANATAAVLNRLARVAASQPWAYPKAGQYMYTYSVEAYDDDTILSGAECVVLSPEHRQIWIGPDGSGMIRESFGRGTFTSAADRRVCAAHGLLGTTAPHPATNQWFGRRGLSDGPTNEQKLPTDATRLRWLIMSGRVDGGPHTDAEAFVRIGDLLRETDASPKLRAALYRVAGTIPGVRALGPTRDHRGRLGIGLAYGNETLIFNPRTAALMGETYRDAQGRVVEWAVYLVSRVVDRIPYKR